MTYGDFKNLGKRSVSDKVLRDKAFNVIKNPKYDGYQRGLASKVYKFFDKNTKGSGVNNDIKQNEESVKELRKPIFKKVKRIRKLNSSIKDSTWSANLSDILIKKFTENYTENFELIKELYTEN